MMQSSKTALYSNCKKVILIPVRWSLPPKKLY